MSREIPDWIVIDATRQCQRCTRCGREEALVVPTLVDAFVLRAQAFAADHRDCQSMTREVTDGPEAA